ncbi:hypothetical protein T439DRAFT_226569 [Meredithblackwellia eburnea MCA 4105]
MTIRLFNLTRSFAVRSTRTTPTNCLVSSFRPISSSATNFYPTSPTHSEDAVKADRGEHEGDEDIATLQRKTTTINTKTVEEKIIPQEHHEHRPHHPGRSDIEHLEDPTSSEESVHADRIPVSTDDLVNKANKKSGSKRGLHTSARDLLQPAPGDARWGQHVQKSGHDHLDQPTVAEEAVHADRSSKNPLDEATREVRKSNSAPEGVLGNVVTQGGQKVNVQTEDSILNH